MAGMILRGATSGPEASNAARSLPGRSPPNPSASSAPLSAHARTTAVMPPEADHLPASHTYLLDAEGKPRREPDWDRWLEWMQANDQPLAETHVARGVLVATRFMGID